MGILANSASRTMTSSSSDDSASGYLTREVILLSLPGTTSGLTWALSSPQGSAAALSTMGGAAPRFTPDVPGFYVITCTVGATTYVLRLGVSVPGTAAIVDGITLLPRANASVATPALGAVVFFSSDSSALVAKLADGTVHPIVLG